MPRWTKLFFFNDTATTEIYTLSLHDALPIYTGWRPAPVSERTLSQVLTRRFSRVAWTALAGYALVVVLLFAVAEMALRRSLRSEEHTSELQSRLHLVCRLLLEKKKKTNKSTV